MLRHIKKKEKRERKDAYQKKVCHMLRHVKKKRKERKDSPYPKRRKTEMVHTKEFIHHPPKIIYTLAHLDQGL